MSNQNLGLLIIAVMLAIAGVAYYLKNAETPSVPNTPGQVACTMEAKLCPDGSYVGRQGPNCEFAACPPGAEK